MPKPSKRSQEQVRKCVAEMKVLLSELSDRHPPLVVLAALTEHVGGALFLCQESGMCSPARVRAVLRRVEQLTFADLPRAATPPAERT